MWKSLIGIGIAILLFVNPNLSSKSLEVPLIQVAIILIAFGLDDIRKERKSKRYK